MFIVLGGMNVNQVFKPYVISVVYFSDLMLPRLKWLKFGGADWAQWWSPLGVLDKYAYGNSNWNSFK